MVAVLKLLIRLLIAAVTAGGVGPGSYLLALGLLPEFSPVGPTPEGDRRLETDREIVVVAPEFTESPALRATKRREATALGIGCFSGAGVFLGAFVFSRRWVA